jgi:hypothetical protein
MFKCYLNNDGYDVIYYVNENFMNGQCQLNYGDIIRSISNLKTLILKLLVHGYRIEIMVECIYRMIMHRYV